jgi:hypothetical protein
LFVSSLKISSLVFKKKAASMRALFFGITSRQRGGFVGFRASNVEFFRFSDGAPHGQRSTIKSRTT